MPVERTHLDAWGLPASNASRRDTEDMLARVGRSETESSEAFRRIEDQLRGVSRRLDSSERSHSESNRVLSRTAQEINIATREQSQAFDQLGLNVMALSERLERVERTTASDGIRDAVDGTAGFGGLRDSRVWTMDGDDVPDFQDPDSDNDGVNDGGDNCRVDPNGDQDDMDEDGVGDACDDTDDRSWGLSGGCSCDTGRNSDPTGALVLGFAVVAIVTRRRRRQRSGQL